MSESTIEYDKVEVFSDGSSRGNPGIGGYGTIVKFYKDDKLIKVEEFAGKFDLTTNNRMELEGVIVGLSQITIPIDNVTVTTDSSYVVNAFNKGWIYNWLNNNWKTSGGKDVKNKDLWERLLLVKKPHKVNFVWVKGHADHPENNRCDLLATSVADSKSMEKKNGLYIIN